MREKRKDSVEKVSRGKNDGQFIGIGERISKALRQGYYDLLYCFGSDYIGFELYFFDQRSVGDNQ